MRCGRGKELSFAVQAQGFGTEQDPLECLAKRRYVCMPIQIRAFRTCSRISGLAVDFSSRPRMQMADAQLATGRVPRLAARQFYSRMLGQDVHLAWKDLAITATLLSRTCSYDHFGSRLSEIRLLPSTGRSPRSELIRQMERGIYLASESVTFTFWTTDSRRERPWTVTEIAIEVNGI